MGPILKDDHEAKTRYPRAAALEVAMGLMTRKAKIIRHAVTREGLTVVVSVEGLQELMDSNGCKNWGELEAALGVTITVRFQQIHITPKS